MNYELRMKNRGFTLIETLFAILIFSTALATLLVVSGGGIANADFAKNQMIASSLAREGIEMVRNIRDNNFLNGGNWIDDFLGINGAVTQCTMGGCIINPIDLAVSPCSDPLNCRDSNNNYLEYDNNDGFYKSPATTGFFQRYIEVNSLPGDYEAEVTSIVFWNQGAVQRQVTFTENLFNWY